MISLSLLLMIAIVVSVDTFVVCLTIGTMRSDQRYTELLRIAAMFSSAACMLLIAGWVVAESILAQSLADYQWIGSLILMAIGIQMLSGNASSDQDAGSAIRGVMRNSELVAMSILTSLDTSGVGGAIAIRQEHIGSLLPMLAAVSFTSAIIGILIGTMLRDISARGAEIAGGMMLVAIGFGAIWM